MILASTAFIPLCVWNDGEHRFEFYYGYVGETEVEVIDIRIQKESELGLPVERYKRVVKKA